jgi:hypothetical protein
MGERREPRRRRTVRAAAICQPHDHHTRIGDHLLERFEMNT